MIDLTQVSDADLIKEWSRRRSAKRGTHTGGRPKVLRPCPKCGARFGAADLRKHQPQCGEGR